MPTRVVLHVGAPKSGTTYLQTVLRSNAEALADSGVLVAGATHLELVHAGLVVREDPRVATLPEGSEGAWERIVEEVRHWQGRVVVISYELFAGATAEQAAAAVADLERAGGDVHVVFTARDFGRSLASAWQERLKFATTVALENWRPRREEDGPRAEWGWRTMDPAGVLARWGSTLPADHVHVVTVPRSPATPTELWDRFAAACGIARVRVDLDVTTTNESMGPAAAELLRRVNKGLPADFGGNRAHARWLRDLLAHEVLIPTDTGRLAISDEQFAQALELSRRSIGQIQERGYVVHGDLADLEASRPDGLLPSQVPDERLVEVAVDAIIDLLLRLRETTEQLEAGRARPALGARVRRRLGRLRTGSRS